MRWRQRISNRRQRAQKDHDRSHIFIGEFFVLGVWHHGKNDAVVVLNAFADGTGDLVIGPAVASGLGVWRQIGRDDGAGKTLKGQGLSDKVCARHHGSPVLRPVFGRVAGFAT